MNNTDKALVMYEVPEKYLQTILDYLAQRPYKEVHGLVKLVQSLRPVQAPALAAVPAPEAEVPAQTN